MTSRSIASDAGIEKAPGVCGGDARIAGTRIPVWLLVAFRQEGVSDAELLRSYPSLSADDLVHAWQYAAAHGDEIAVAIEENENDDRGDEA
jgi:uncharacterized protein (DUF433 family)